MQKGDILLHGHTHIPACEEFETYTYLNPGSVSIPKEQSPHSYMVFDGHTFLWKNLETGEIYNQFSV
jgi:putative phosphoesterase